MMHYEIRIATCADRASVQAVVNSAYAHYVARIGRKPGPMSDDYAALIRANRVHVAESHGAIHGVLVLIPEQDAMLLDNVAVDPLLQVSGIGRKLLQFAEQAALKAGYRTIRLYTNQAMTENIALYARIGYVETHRGEEKGLHRVYMTKQLA